MSKMVRYVYAVNAKTHSTTKLKAAHAWLQKQLSATTFCLKQTSTKSQKSDY